MRPLTPDLLTKLRRRRLPRTGNKIAIALELSEAKAMDIVRATGFAPQYVSDIKNGRTNNLKIASARKFATFFGCSIDDLFPPREGLSA
jgi:transcriptional regulator with XRE-family HTH domain